MSDNLNLTAEEVAGLVRKRNPDYWAKFTDEEIIRSTAQYDPGIYKNIRFDTLGEKFYKQYGNDASAGFGKRFSFQMGQLWDGTKTGMVGLFTDVETGEEWRRFSETLYQRKVASDPELQAYFAWKEDEPTVEGWNNIDVFFRSMSEALPSLAVSMTSTALAYALIPSTAGASLAMLGTAISMAPMFAMEAGNEYNEVMKMMVDEMGVDPEEAKKYATTASIGYGVASSFLERVGSMGFLGSIGIKRAVAKKTFADKMSRAVIDYGVDRGTLTWMGTRAGAGSIRLLEGALSEGLTEGTQALLQTATNRAIELGYGEDGLDPLSSAYQAFKEASKDPAVFEEAYAGATMGVGGGVKGAFIDKGTLGEIAAKEAKEREKRIEKVERDKVVEADPVETKNLFKSFIDAVLSPDEKMGEVLSAVEETTEGTESELSEKIRETVNIADPSKKILSVIQNNPELVDEISKGKNASRIVDLIYDDLNAAYQKENEGKKLPKNKKAVFEYAKQFADRGQLTAVEPDVDDTQFQEMEQEYEVEMAPAEAEQMVEQEYPESDMEEPDPSDADFGGQITIDEDQKKTDYEKIPSGLAKLKLTPLRQIAKNVGGIKGYTKMSKEELVEKLSEKKLEKYFEPEQRVQIEGGLDGSELVVKVDGQKVDISDKQKKTLLGLGKIINRTAANLGKGLASADLLGVKREIMDEFDAKSAPDVAPAPPAEVYDEVAPSKPSKETAPPKEIKKDSVVQLTKDMVNMLKKKYIKISTSYKKALEKVQELQNNKDVDEIKVLGSTSKLLKVQGFDKDGKTIGGILSIPKLIGGRPTLDVIEGVVSDEVTQAPQEAPQQEPPSEIAEDEPGDDVQLMGVAPEGQKVAEDQPGEDTEITQEVAATPGGTVTSEPINPETGEPFKRLEGLIDAWTFTTDPREMAEEASLDDLWSVKDRPGIDAAKRKIYNEVFDERIAALEKPAPTPKKTEKRNLDDLLDDQDTDEVDFQDDMSSEEQLISENTRLANKILNRLKKYFPEVETLEFEGLLEEEGADRIGFSLNKLAAWSITDGRMDTMPHEYAHIYVKLLKNNPLIKRGIKLFGSEEALVKEIGLYYASRSRDTSALKKIKIWLRQFANRLRKLIGKPVKDEDIFQFIAEEFYQGRWLGIKEEFNLGTVEYDTVNNETNTPNDETHEATQGEADADVTAIPNDIHQAEFFSEALGVYIDRRKDYPLVIDMAAKSKSYGQYKQELLKWAKNLVDTRKRKGDKLNEIVPGSKEDNLLRLDWLKQKARIRRYIPGKKGRDNNRQGNDTRVYQRWILNGTEGIEIDGTEDLRTGKAHPETYTMNFIEQQFEGTDMRMFILPIKQILNKRTYKDRDYYVEGKNNVTENDLEKIELDYKGRYVKKIMSQLSQVEDVDELLIALESGNLLTVVGTKLGDNSAILSTKTTNDIKPTKLNFDKFKAVLQAEVTRGTMTQDMVDTILRETRQELADLTAEFENLVEIDEVTDYTVEGQINDWIKEFGKDNIQSVKEMIIAESKLIKSQLIINSIYSQALSRIKFWQEVRTPDYMMHERSAADSLTRLSIDMAEGVRPYGLGTGQLMIIDENVEVRVAKVDASGKPIPGTESEYRGKYKDYDGATFTAGTYLGKIAKQLGKILPNGRNPLKQLKTFIRKRTPNEETGKVDYLGMKHMQFSAFKGMQFYEDGVLIAQVEGQGDNTYFRDMNPESPTFNQKFDMIASPNEAKVTVNGYDEKNKLIPIDESEILVHSIMDKSKLNASHPIALGEMLLTIHDSREAKALLKAIEGRYAEVLNYYTTKINQFFEDPSKFREFLKTEVDAGKVPTELQEYFALLKEDGMGIFHPALITHILPVINATIIRNGILKGRAWGKKSSLTYLKPAAHLKLAPPSEDNIGEVAVSGDNTVAVDEVERRFFEAEGIKGREKKNYWKNNAPGRMSPFNHKLTTLNTWLETNEVNILIHRNPIAKVTGPVMRKVRSIVKGNQGEVLFMSNEDVVNVLDGDWDGDKAAFEFISESHVEAMKDWQSSEKYKNVDRQVLVDLWGARTDKDKSVGKTSILSKNNVQTEVVNNSRADGGTGVMTNAKTLMSQLWSKGFKIEIQAPGGGTEVISIANPNDEVTMGYKALDETQLTHENLKVIKNNNDKITNRTGSKVYQIKTHKNGKLYVDTGGSKVYLTTTKSHEISILFQMAVDAVKYRHWGEIIKDSGLDNYNFMLSKVFVRPNGVPIDNPDGLDKMVRTILGKVYNTQNISRIRGGKVGDKSAEYDMNLLMSEKLKDRMYDVDDNLLSNEEYSNNFLKEVNSKRKKGNLRVKSITLKNKPSPAEQLIAGVSMNIGDTNFHHIYSRKDYQQTAHIMAMEDMWQAIIGKKEYADYIAGENLDDAAAVHNFLHQKRIFEKSDKAWSMRDIWKKLQEDMGDKNMSARTDLKADMTNFVDRFIDEFNELSDTAKTFATIEMLSGFEADINILKLPPLKLMDKEVLKIYLPLFEKHLRNLDYNEVKKSPKDRRTQSLYINEQTNMFKQHQAEDGYMNLLKKDDC